MIEIDGSLGEGGGQILRTALSLSAVVGQPVKVSNIRAKRPRPGLAPSHVTSIEAVAELCDADVDNLFPGSKDIVFKPGQLTGGSFEFDVGTAGSISLVLLTCLLPAVLSRSRVSLTIKGGTDVNWSPPIDYVRLVHLPILTRFGPGCDIEVSARGFYPEGGGEVTAEITPVSKLEPVDLSTRGDVLEVQGVAFAQNLPEHVVSRIKHAALKALVGFNQVKVDSDLRRGHSTGAGIVLAAVCGNTVLGETGLGARGIRSESLGENCAADLVETIASGASVDDHMLDQILPYMALAEGRSAVLAEELTDHANTNMQVIEKMLGRGFVVSEKGGLKEVATG